MTNEDKIRDDKTPNPLIRSLHKIATRSARKVLEPLRCGWASSVGLEYIDLQLAAILGRRRNGVFIEAGANDGIQQSNTYYLEKVLGWRGLLVEPLPRQAKCCKRRRKRSIVENAALVAFGGPASVTIQPAGLMTVVDDNYLTEEFVAKQTREGRRIQHLPEQLDVEAAPAFPLQHLTDKHGISSVDFFSLDVEGYEAEVLNGIDFSKLKIKRIFVETRSFNAGPIHETLKNSGYHVERSWNRNSCSDILYTLEEEL